MADTVSRLAIQVGMETQALQAGTNRVSSIMGELASRFRLSVDPIQLAGSAMNTVGRLAKEASEAYVGLGMATQDVVAQLKQVSASAEELKTLKDITFDFGGGFFEDEKIAKVVSDLRRANSEIGDIGPSLEVIGKLAAGTGSGLDDMAAKLRKIAADGAVSFKDLKALEADAIPITSQLAIEFGTTEEAVRKLAAEGKISLAQLGESLEALTGKGGKFFDSIEAQNDTLRGQVRGLKDDLEDLFRADAEAFANTTAESIKALRTNAGRGAFFDSLKNNPLSILTGAIVPFSNQFAEQMAKVNQEAAAFEKLGDALKKTLSIPEGQFSNAFSKMAEQAKEDLDERTEAFRKAGERLRESLLTPQEEFNKKLGEANELRNAGVITEETYSRAIEKAREALDKQTQSVQKQRTELEKINQLAGAPQGLVRGSAAAASAVANNSAAMLQIQKQQLKALGDIVQLFRDTPPIGKAKLN